MLLKKLNRFYHGFLRFSIENVNNFQIWLDERMVIC